MAIHNKQVGDKTFQDGEVNNTVVQPGDTILFDVGTHVAGTHIFTGFVGTAEDPITIDLNGQTIDGNQNNIIMRVKHCQYINIINGTLHNSSTQGLYCPQSWGIHIEDITVYNVQNTAIRIGYQGLESEPERWRSTGFIDPYARVINCTVYDAFGQAEGIYAGASNPHWYQEASDGTAWQYPLLAECTISGNTVYNTAYDGIQVGSCQKALVFDNEVYNYGTDDDASDQNGIQMGTGTRGLCFNNYVHDSGAASGGSFIFSQGDGTIVFNNIGHNGYNGGNLGSSYTFENKRSYFINNTFVGIKGTQGIHVNGKYFRDSRVFNNIIHFDVEPDGSTEKYLDFTSQSHKYLEGNNLLTHEGEHSLSQLFNDHLNDDFTLKAGSPAIGAGANLSHLNSNLIKNFSSSIRPIVGDWDIGAH